MVKNSPANAGDIRDMGSIPGLGRSPGGGKGGRWGPKSHSCSSEDERDPASVSLPPLGSQRVWRISCSPGGI